MTVRRPALRYHGGKWVLAPWIISHFPAHKVYVEPFGGAASVLMRKPKCYAEVYNDLDGEIVGFFRVLQSPETNSEFLRRLKVTPFSRDEFNRAYETTDCEIERARRLVIRSFQGFGSDGCNDAAPTGFRASAKKQGNSPAHDWISLPQAYEALIERLAGVVIENRCGLEVMQQQDSAETLHYVDPPYLHATRSRPGRKNYRYELSDDDHRELLSVLLGLKGAVVLSGYANALYDDVIGHWRRIDRKAMADGASERMESLWLNPAADERDLFSGVAA
ncbi:MAG: DNA adenine methylase [Henriciella sp.]|nr:DNA adenine methylase [Henriciella sp.]